DGRLDDPPPIGRHQQKRTRRFDPFLPDQSTPTTHAGYRVEDALDGHRYPPLWQATIYRARPADEILSIAALLTRRDKAGIVHTITPHVSRPFLSARTDRWPQESEVAAVVGAENFLRIELGIAALGLHLRGLDRRGARFQFDLFDQEVDTTFLHRKADAVAAADEAEGAAGRRIRGHMQYYRPERGAAHPCVRDSDHILDPPLGEFFREGEVARRGHAFARVRAGILQHQHVLRSDVERWVVDARGKIGKGGENHCPARVFEQFCIGRRALEDGALGSEVSKQGNEPSLRFERLVAAGNNRPVEVTGNIGRKALAQRLAGHRHAIKVEQRLELAQKRTHPAGGEKILHIAVADPLEVDQYPRRVREPIETLEGKP